MAKDTLVRDIRLLETELKGKQEAFIRRERVYKTRIDELENTLATLRTSKTEWMQKDPSMAEVRKHHAAILSNVAEVQNRTARLVQEQERDLLTAFRARLLDVQAELQKEKSKKDDGAAAWIDRSRQLELEVDREKERADKLDRINQALGQENTRLKQQFQTQEDDRSFLVRQLVVVKNENSELREDLQKKDTELQDLQDELTGALAKGGMAATSSSQSLPLVRRAGAESPDKPEPAAGASVRLLPRQEADERYREIIKRLTRMPTRSASTCARFARRTSVSERSHAARARAEAVRDDVAAEVARALVCVRARPTRGVDPQPEEGAAGPPPRPPATGHRAGPRRGSHDGVRPFYTLGRRQLSLVVVRLRLGGRLLSLPRRRRILQFRKRATSAMERSCFVPFECPAGG